MISNRIPKRSIAGTIAVAILTVFTVSVAWAYWSTVGSGTASASTANLSAPTSVNASANGAIVTITWSAPTTKPATTVGYRVFRTNTSTSTSTAVCGISTPTTTLSCTDSATSGTYTYTVSAIVGSWTSTSAPAGPVQVVVAAPSVSVTSPANSSTFTGTPAISGTASDTSSVTVKIYSGNSPSGSLVQTLITAPSSGNWSTTPSTLAAGTYTVTASQANGVGTTTTSGNTFSIVTSAPSVAVTSPSNNNTFTSTPAISGTASDISSVAVKIYSGTSATGTPVQSLTATPSSGGWSITPAALSPGNYTVTATQANAVGTTTTGGNTFSIVTSAPTVTVTSPANGSTVTSSTPAISGTASGITNVTVRIYSGTPATGALVQTLTTAPSSGSWSTTPAALTNGNYTVTASQNNAAGTTTTSGNAFTVPVGPTVTINQALGQADPTNASPINFTVSFARPVTGFGRSGVTIGGTAGGTVSVSVTGSGSTYTVAVSIAGTTTGTVTASVNANAAFDSAGLGNAQSSSTDATVSYDTVGPDLSNTNYNDSAGNDSVGGATEAGATITLLNNATSTAINSLTVGSNGTWSVNVGKNGPGVKYDYTVTATDALGNQTVLTVAGTATK